MPYQLRKDEFERLLRERRLRKGEVSMIALSMSDSVFSRVVKGERLLTLDLAQKLATFMGVPHTYLFIEVEGATRGRPRIDGIGYVNREVVKKARDRLDLYPFVKFSKPFIDLVLQGTLKQILLRNRKIEAVLAERMANVLQVSVAELISSEDPAFVRATDVEVKLTRDEEIKRHPNRPPSPVTDPAELPTFMRHYAMPLSAQPHGHFDNSDDAPKALTLAHEEIVKTKIMDEEEFEPGEEGADEFGPLSDEESEALGLNDGKTEEDP